MDALVAQVRGVLRDPDVSDRIEERMRAFFRVRDEGDERLFLELCFCLLTANFQSEKSMIIHEAIGSGFLALSERDLAKRLRLLGYRFPNVRARFIVEARVHSSILRAVVYGERSDGEKREWLVTNVKGLGLKEASHFLRNVGIPSFPIIDRHIVAVLVREGLIGEVASSISKRRYLEIEQVMDALAAACGLDHGRLDFALWYLSTGRVLK